VSLKQADGTVVPLKDAVIKFYRTDIKAEYTAKTDKNGHYVNVGIPLIGTYTIAISGPGARPDFMAGVKISQQPENNFTLEPGDGSALSLDQIKAARAAAPAGGGAPTAADSAEAKKKAAERAAEVARINAENEKAKELNAKLPDILKAGNDALIAKKYDEAITHYDEGITADPTQSVFYRNKAIALRARGVDRFNAAIKARDNAGKEAARNDFKAATESAEKSVAAYREAASKRAPGAAATPGQPNEEVGYLFDRAESYRIALQTATPIDNEAAVKAIQEYVAAETDEAKKAKMQASLGDAMFAAGRIDDAIGVYRAALTANANNLDAMRGLGIALAAQDPSKFPEAREMLQQFVSKAPDTDPRKAEAQQMVQYLDDTMKTAATKPMTIDTTKPKSGRKKP
jgi:tetratricopeptide (TPR) repeat protein